MQQISEKLEPQPELIITQQARIHVYVMQCTFLLLFALQLSLCDCVVRLNGRAFLGLAPAQKAQS